MQKKESKEQRKYQAAQIVQEGHKGLTEASQTASALSIQEATIAAKVHTRQQLSRSYDKHTPIPFLPGKLIYVLFLWRVSKP